MTMISISEIRCLLWNILFCSFCLVSALVMSSIYGYIGILLYFLSLCIIRTDSRSIIENDVIEVVVDSSSKDDDEHGERLLANYRHRFEHSPNLKKLRWAMGSQSDRAYCDFCDLVVPVVDISIELFFSRIVASLCQGPITCWNKSKWTRRKYHR